MGNNKINALVVDDNEGDIILLRNKLAQNDQYNFSLQSAQTILEAQKYLANSNEQKIDVVLLDLNLADSQGYQTIENFLELQAGIPVIIMTGLAENNNTENKALQNGVQDYVLKSNDIDLGKSIIHAIERHKLQKALQEKIEELEIAKYEAQIATQAKSDFLAKMSHEIRTPLFGLLGFIEQLNDTFLDKEQRRMVDYIGSSGQVLMRVVSDILDLSKIEAGQLTLENEPFDLKTTVEACAAIIEGFARSKKLNFEYKMDENCPECISGDILRFQQVLLNLLNNAVKFTDIGFVKLQVDYEQSDKKSGKLIIRVADSGVGIPDDQKDTIFHGFNQAKISARSAYAGTGLGLTITKEIVDAMKGEICYESADGTGTTFYVEIPVKTGLAEQIQSPQYKNIKADKELKILVVEDLLINQELTQNMIEHVGHTVTIANNGKEAVELIAHENYDLVLMDIQMPIMNGIDAARFIREDLKIDSVKLPIIALTAHITLSDAKPFFEAGMNDYLVKPVNVKKLQEKIVEVTEGPSLAFVEAPYKNKTNHDETRREQDFNQKSYNDLIDFVGRQKAEELRNMFFTDCDKRFDTIKNDNLSSADIKHNLHSMISMSGYLGFEKISIQCRAFVDRDDDVTQKDLDELQNYYQNIKENFSG